MDWDKILLMENKIKALELKSKILKKSNDKVKLKLEAMISDKKIIREKNLKFNEEKSTTSNRWIKRWWWYKWLKEVFAQQKKRKNKKTQNEYQGLFFPNRINSRFGWIFKYYAGMPRHNLTKIYTETKIRK